MNSKSKFGFLLVLVVLVTSVNLKPEALTAQQILDLVNNDRASHGLSQLELDPVLTLAALAKAEDMTSNNYFAHTSPDGATPWQWFRAMGYNYTYAGENLAEGYTDPYELEKSWMASAPHRANILSPNFEEVGLAIVEHKNTNLIVQLFGSKDAKLTFQK
jgi:uncharacterized protein YkwD